MYKLIIIYYIHRLIIPYYLKLVVEKSKMTTKIRYDINNINTILMVKVSRYSFQ